MKAKFFEYAMGVILVSRNLGKLISSMSIP
jgi:hypothetical protein